MKRHTYRVQIAYDGAAFAAFAPVPGERTVWSTLRSALQAVAPGFGRMAAGGRTDRGVSATGQVISFISRDPVECAAIARAMTSSVPCDWRGGRDQPCPLHALRHHDVLAAWARVKAKGHADAVHAKLKELRAAA